ncbi:MAG TPA: S-methyl-5-thioribose-1-phosphate isomerase [Thermoplasmata archaeon]|jgi:translation initiation factor eIF-2B subunit alpha/methylthioribose-1-phosphate isomerase|nr:S-methyl-5-thioribose-1-phosphate isomerase [Thermoplasmata archaeon]
MRVRALWYRNGTLHLIDQRELPQRTVVRRLRHVRDVASAIRTMVVRGAPAIGVSAAYGMVLAYREGSIAPARAARMLRETRPTAHDLVVGLETVKSAWVAGEDPVAAADRYREKVVEECHRIGLAGAPLLARSHRVLTHCNAGALATVEWGTALAPIRVARERGAHLFVWVDETRPLLQGARLTAWELAREHIPHAVIVDNAAGAFMRRGEVDAVIVGADRIARNGDFANKIGTYEKAVVAHENGIPFYVAAPWSTFDDRRASGRTIPVEERGEEEVLGAEGHRIAPRTSRARNPAFDVTPANYVTAFVTPAGVVRPRSLAKVLDRRPKD